MICLYQWEDKIYAARRSNWGLIDSAAHVWQDGPGNCPSCGMALEPLDATASANNAELRDVTRRLRGARSTQKRALDW